MKLALFLFSTVAWAQQQVHIDANVNLSTQPQGLDPNLIIQATKGPTYEPMSEAHLRAARARQAELQNKLAEQAIQMNALRLQQGQPSPNEHPKTGTQLAETTRIKALEEWLDKLESVLFQFFSMEAEHWAKNNESLDILAQGGLGEHGMREVNEVRITALEKGAKKEGIK